MYLKFSFEETVVNIPALWGGKFVTLCGKPSIVSQLPNEVYPFQETEIVYDKSTKTRYYNFYYDCYHLNPQMINQALVLFYGPVLLEKNSTEHGFYTGLDSGNLSQSQNIFDGEKYALSNDKQAFIKQFELALQQVRKHQHHANIAGFFHHAQQIVDDLNQRSKKHYRLR